MPPQTRRASELANMMDMPSTPPVAPAPVERQPEPAEQAGEVVRQFAGVIDHPTAPAPPPSMRPARQEARSVTIGVRSTPAAKDYYEQWCRAVAARYGVKAAVVTAHVCDALIASLPEVERRIADWLRE